MSPTAADWDARIDRLTGRLPGWTRDAIAWLSVPSRRLVRLAAALALIAGGVLSFLPILGPWMLPLGLALLSEDIPALKPQLEMAAQAGERLLSRFRKSWPVRARVYASRYQLLFGEPERNRVRPADGRA